jgi:hypothetical protein
MTAKLLIEGCCMASGTHEEIRNEKVVNPVAQRECVERERERERVYSR